MIPRLGDGVEGKSDTLGGGLTLGGDEFSLGARSSLFLGLRPARHDQVLLGVAGAAPPPTGGQTPDRTGGEGPGGGDGGGTGDGGGDGGGGDGGDGG